MTELPGPWPGPHTDQTDMGQFITAIMLNKQPADYQQYISNDACKGRFGRVNSELSWPTKYVT